VGTSGTSTQGATIHVPEESVCEVEIEGAENQEATREDDSNSVSAEKSTEHVCIVCLKKRKKHSGREQQQFCKCRTVMEFGQVLVEPTRTLFWRPLDVLLFRRGTNIFFTTFSTI
jgi:hypothetical protein